MSKYETAARHCEEGVLCIDSLGDIYCTTHGDEDIPSWDEIRSNVTAGHDVEVHPGNGVLYVIATGGAL